MNNKNPNDDFLARWLSGELSKGDLSPEDQADIVELEKITNFTSQLQVPVTQTPEEAWEKFSRLIEKEEPPTVRPLFPWVKVISGIAAGLAILVSVFVFFQDSDITYQTPVATQQTIYLPDSSFVILNAVSTLAYNEDNWENKREITLSGEGFVQVKKGSPFIVNTSKGTVSVLGTSFNILDRKNSYAVACYTGKVRVEDNKGKVSEILTPGLEMRIADDGTWQQGNFEVKDVQPQWAEGMFRFSQTPFKEVIDEFERQFKIEVEYPEMVGRTYTGAFFNNDVNVALQMICDPMDLSFKFVDKSHVTLMPLSR